ncbi:hypothetical protein CYMTET_46708 [Cymbomonas tetramitiformis]|uniref:Uncharacterized protein n=1 Tax=Cymbomonas tetramitiformis TaxID=36881 RepID=A0AAE0EWU1_9CHLO|nr:hypothetical protein CYMTET_46708 [Cymbomonas tetramitiformis]
MASLLKSTRVALFSRIVVTLAVEGRATAPKDIDALVELADAQQLPMPVASVADRESVEPDPDYDSEEENELPGLESGSDSEDGEIPLDELPEGMVDQPKRVPITAAAAFAASSRGVEDFGVKGRVHAGTIPTVLENVRTIVS